MIRSTAESVAAEYGPEYWREKGERRVRPEVLGRAVGGRFHGLLVPEEYDGAGKGMQEMGLTMETLCAEGVAWPARGIWYSLRAWPPSGSARTD